MHARVRMHTCKFAHARGRGSAGRQRVFYHKCLSGEMMCDSNHFVFPELVRWSVLFKGITTPVVRLWHKQAHSGGRGLQYSP